MRLSSVRVFDYPACLQGTQEKAKSSERKQKETTVLKSIDLKGVLYPSTEAHIEDIELAKLRSKNSEKGHKAKVVEFSYQYDDRQKEERHKHLKVREK